MVRPPRPGAPAVSRSGTSLVAGSGHSGYGVGLAGRRTRLTVAPSTTRWPAPVATADARVSVLPAMFVIRRVVLVIVPLAFVWGIVSVKPIRNGLVSATVSVAVLDCSPVTVDWRGGRALASRTTHDFGRFSTPFCCPHK